MFRLLHVDSESVERGVALLAPDTFEDIFIALGAAIDPLRLPGAVPSPQVGSLVARARSTGLGNFRHALQWVLIP